MLTCALQSGSNGNCIYVETADVRLLFDAGIAARTVQTRLAGLNRDVGQADALILSHNHRDHVCGAGVLQRRFGLPIWVTRRAWQHCRADLGTCPDVRHFAPGDTIILGRTSVFTVPTAHDGIDGVAFVIADRGRRLGIFTDLGHRFAGIEDWIAELDGLYLESNYDPQMLAEGPYPGWLKNRVAGLGGHLSNPEAAQLVRDCARRLRFLVLAHLSEHNNRPELALRTAREIIGPGLPIALAPRHAAGDVLRLD